MNSLLRRLPLSRLLAVCGAVVVAAVSATAAASALDSGPVPAHRTLAAAIHDALTGAPVEGVTARIQYTNHLLEGANLASGTGQGNGLASSPLVQGASGRLWIAKDGRARLELQADGGDTEVLLSGRTVTIYDGTSNTVYRYTLPAKEGSGQAGETGSGAGGGETGSRQAPSVAQIEESLSRLERHAKLSGASATDIAGQPAYTARISPKEDGSLIGGLALSWDAVHGVPLRAAVYSSASPSPVIELAATEVSYGPVESGVFDVTPPRGAKIVELGGKAGGSGSTAERPGSHTDAAPGGGGHGKLTKVGHGVSSVLVFEGKAQGNGAKAPSGLEGLKKVDINGATASELPTALGTLLTFERAGVRYVVAGARGPAAVEAVARGL